MNARVPEMEGIDGFVEILGPEVGGKYGQKVENSIHDDENPDCDMNRYAEFPDASSIRTFGNSARRCRNHVEHHHACICAWLGASWRLRICYQ